MDVSNKIVFITGGLGGIGQALTKEFIKNGAKGIAIADVNASPENNIVKELQASLGADKIIAIKCDVRVNEDIKQALDETIKRFKNLDIVVNGAGLTSEDWELEIDVNYKGAYRVLQLALKEYLPKYKSGEEGVLVNIASIAGWDGLPVVINYSATKAALISLGRSYSNKIFYNQYKVKVLTICPGYTNTTILVKAMEREENLKKLLDSIECQTPEDLSQNIIEIIGKFKNGDMYVCEGNRIEKIRFPQRSECIVDAN